jgi:mannose-6-phosphate isomerase-like protein (cupin superfamily)
MGNGIAAEGFSQFAFASHLPDMVRAVRFSIIVPEQLEWSTRAHEPGEPARHVAELQDLLRFEHTRANLWRYEPGARGRRHVHSGQEETFVVIAGRLTMYLGEPPERQVVPVGGIVHVRSGTPLQTVNEAEEDLVLYAYGSPPDEGAEVLPSAA